MRISGKMKGQDMGLLETKFHRLDEGLGVEAESSSEVRIAGYASVFGVRDRGGDVVLPGAYAASLARMAAAGERVRMLWQHDQGAPIGVWDAVGEDARGLKVGGRILLDVARGREAAALVRAGALDGLSIGYRTRRSEALPGGGRRLIELDLWEVSLVTFPMLPQARVGAKSAHLPGAFAALAAGLETAGALIRSRA